MLNLLSGLFKMKKNKLCFSLMLLLLFTSVAAKSQHVGSASAAGKIKLFTDRSLYISGDPLHFAAFIVPAAFMDGESDNVLYVEIISGNGRSFARGKFSIM